MVEVDETFIGGKSRNMHKADRARKIKGTGGMGKVAVMGLLERHSKKGHSTVKVSVVPDRKKQTLAPVSTVAGTFACRPCTDALKSYERLPTDYVHGVIDHAEAYV